MCIVYEFSLNKAVLKKGVQPRLSFNDRFFTLVSQNHMEGLLKIRLLGFIAVSDSVCLGWGLRMYISDYMVMFQGSR